MCHMSEGIGAIAKALAAAQAELQPAAKNAQNPHLKNRYADIASVYEAIREALPKHGLAVTQLILPSPEGKAHVRTVLMHESGEWLASECILPPDRAGGVQGIGSAITYARRYSLSAIVGVVSEDDDDGNAAQPKQQPRQQPSRPAAASPASAMTQAQSNALMAYLTKRHGTDRAAYLAELSGFFNRQISSSRELTRDEVSDFLSAVQHGQQEETEWQA